MSANSEDNGWQDECFKFLRIVVGVIAEYSPMIKDSNSPAGWALTDLRDVNHDLLIALENCDEPAAEMLLLEARAVLVEVILLAG
jgi:hypothetical protein